MMKTNVFTLVKAGDMVSRQFGNDGPIMTLHVTSVDDKFIYCGPPGDGWKFDRATGAEVDEELEWGPNGTGSVLIDVIRLEEIN